MYAVVHGGTDEELRAESAEYLASLPYDGFAIGGSLGADRSEMLKLLEFLVPRLPADKPNHLLGIADPESAEAVAPLGIDTLDSCNPTRVARHGPICAGGAVKIKQKKYADDFGPIDPSQPTIEHSRAYLHHLFKQHEPLFMTLASLHNLIFMNKLMAGIRERIMRDGRDQAAASAIFRAIFTRSARRAPTIARRRDGAAISGELRHRLAGLAHRPQREAVRATTRAIAQPYQHVGLRCQGKRSGCGSSGERRIDRGGDRKRRSRSREQRWCHGGRSREQYGERSSGGWRHGGGRRAAARLRRVVARLGRRVDAALAHKIGRRRGPSRPQLEPGSGSAVRHTRSPTRRSRARR